MPLVNPLPYIKYVREVGAAIPAFNIHTMEMIQAVVEKAYEKKTPVIIQTSPKTIEHVGTSYIVANVKTAVEQYNIPVALHLDHCSSYEMIIQCIKNGYTSIMVDGSMLPYKENVNFVKEIGKITGVLDIALEGEIGRIKGAEEGIGNNDLENLTTPEEAYKFIKATNLDTLAVAIGTAHGVYKGEPCLDFIRLLKIKQKVDIPLVLHGASGVPAESIKKAIKTGMAKINIATDLKIAMAEAIRNYFGENPDGNDPREYLGKGKEALKKEISKKISLCGVTDLLDRMG